MKALALALALTGCIDNSDQGGPWVDATTIAGTFAPEFGPPPVARDAPTCRLRIASWNLHFAPDPANLASQIASSPHLSTADIILTQEIESHPLESGTRASRLATALGMTWIYAPARIEGDGTHGIAILSRFPLGSSHIRQLPYVERPISNVQRIALAADVAIGASTLRVVDIHLDTRLSAPDRIRQMSAATTDLGQPLVGGGDLNTQPWIWLDGTVPVTSTEAVLGESHAQIVDDYMTAQDFTGAIDPDEATMRVPAFSMRLDNMYARDYQIVDAGVEHLDGSDHWPIWLDLAWAGCP